MMGNTNVCSTCKSYRRKSCHNEPPSIDDEGRAVWPLIETPSLEWCGAWETNEPKKPPKLPKKWNPTESVPTNVPKKKFTLKEHSAPKKKRGGAKVSKKICTVCQHRCNTAPNQKKCPSCGKKRLILERRHLEIKKLEAARPASDHSITSEVTGPARDDNKPGHADLPGQPKPKCQKFLMDGDDNHCHTCTLDSGHSGDHRCQPSCGHTWRNKNDRWSEL